MMLYKSLIRLIVKMCASGVSFSKEGYKNSIESADVGNKNCLVRYNTWLGWPGHKYKMPCTTFASQKQK